MKFGLKPVHPCYTCLLNLGDRCWRYDCPRRQWNRKKCPGFENEEVYRQFREWQEAPHVKTRKQLRQETFRKRTVEPHIYGAINFRKARAKRLR